MPEPGEVRVSSLELFFDLVFVFTVTQLTAVLVDQPDLRGLAKVLVVLPIVFWMYGGYAWLTNAIAVDRPQHRVLLLGGMGGFLVLALAIPSAFDGSGTAFGLAYLFVIVLHTALFTQATSEASARAIFTLTPFNAAAAVMVLAGGALGGTAQWVLWAAAAGLEWSTPYLRPPVGFEIARSHFVERHGLVVIIALGESVVAIGIGAEGLPVDAAVVGVALLGLALSAGLWWTYFGDEQRVERAMRAVAPERVGRVAIDGFGYAHMTMLLGIVALAMGVKKTIGHAGEPLDWGVAAFLAGGACLFVVSDVVFRRVLALGRDDRLRLLTAIALLATIPLGALVSGAAELGGLVALLGAGLLAEEAGARRRVSRPAAATAGPGPRARGG